MEISLIGLGIFGILFLTILAIVSNVGEESQENIQREMYLMNCPAPSYDGQYNATNVTIEGFNVILGTNNAMTPYLNNVTYGGVGTVFRCYIDELGSGLGQGVNLSNKNYQEVTLGFPSGAFIYVGDFMGSLFQRLNHMFVLIGYFVTPTNFNILGYTLDDLSGVALMFVVAIYALSYLFVGAMMYKIISPFSGVS